MISQQHHDDLPDQLGAWTFLVKLHMSIRVLGLRHTLSQAKVEKGNTVDQSAWTCS